MTSNVGELYEYGYSAALGVGSFQISECPGILTISIIISDAY